MDRETLRQYRDLSAEAEELTAQIAGLRIKAESRKWPDGQPHSNYAADRLADIAATIADLCRVLDGKQAELLRLLEKIELAIDCLENPRDRRLIRLYYIAGLKWEEVAKKMCYSLDYVWELNEKILEKMQIPQ